MFPILRDFTVFPDHTIHRFTLNLLQKFADNIRIDRRIFRGFCFEQLLHMPVLSSGCTGAPTWRYSSRIHQLLLQIPYGSWEYFFVFGICRMDRVYNKLYSPLPRCGKKEQQSVPNISFQALSKRAAVVEIRENDRVDD